MTARSLIIDLFGDYLRYHGGSAPLQALIALMGYFGVPESTVRVTVTRLQKTGWLASDREGRRTLYALTDAAWDMLDEGRARIFNRSTGPWDGQWAMVLYSVPETQRALRQNARKQLTWLGFGRLTNSVWINAHDRLEAAQRTLEHHAEAGLRLLYTRAAGGLPEDRDMANRCWDLPALAREYDTFRARYEPQRDRYQHGDFTSQEAFLQRVRLVNHYRRFPYHDPDLPPELLPQDWPGHTAHNTFLQLYKVLRDPAETFVDTVLASI